LLCRFDLKIDDIIQQLIAKFCIIGATKSIMFARLKDWRRISMLYNRCSYIIRRSLYRLGRHFWIDQ